MSVFFPLLVVVGRVLSAQIEKKWKKDFHLLNDMELCLICFWLSTKTASATVSLLSLYDRASLAGLVSQHRSVGTD